MSNSKRVDSTRAARVLAERRLDAEEKKFAAGMSTSFLVFQAQRDLSTARNNELRAVLDYTQSQVDYETVQIAPVNGGSSFTSSAAIGTALGNSTGVVGAVARPEQRRRTVEHRNAERTRSTLASRARVGRGPVAYAAVPLFFAPRPTLAPCPPSRPRSSRSTRPPTSPTPSRRSPGPTRSSSSTRAALTGRSTSRAGWPRASRPGVDRLCGAEELRRVDCATRLGPVSRCRRAGRTRSARWLAGVAGRPAPASGYRLPRASWYLGRWIRSTDWYPDPQLRLYDRRVGQWRRRASTNPCASRDRWSPCAATSSCSTTRMRT